MSNKSKKIIISFSEKYSCRTMKDLEILVAQFVEEFYTKNSNIKKSDPFYKKVSKYFESCMQKSHLFNSICDDCEQIIKIQNDSQANKSEKTRLYIVRDNDQQGKMIGFAIAYVSPNEFRDADGQKIICDEEEPTDIIVGEKYVAYLLPEYRTLENFNINGERIKPLSKIAIGLNKMMEDWFSEEGVQMQYTSTGCHMQKNIIAYIANGFFIQKKSKSFVYMKRDVSEPINYKQRAFLVRSIKSGEIPTYGSSSEIPEYDFLERTKISKKSSFDEYVSVSPDIIERVTNVGKIFRKTNDSSRKQRIDIR